MARKQKDKGAETMTEEKITHEDENLDIDPEDVDDVLNDDDEEPIVEKKKGEIYAIALRAYHIGNTTKVAKDDVATIPQKEVDRVNKMYPKDPVFKIVSEEQAKSHLIKVNKEHRKLFNEAMKKLQKKVMHTGRR